MAMLMMVVIVIVVVALVVMEVVVIVLLPQSILHNLLPLACVLIMRPGASLRL